jgi:peptidoglycan/LPS O-acetylase OafA/YrhL
MVDLFFILSGFIISYVYVADRKSHLPRSEVKAFLQTRFARIYPLHVFSLLYLTTFTLGSALVLWIAGRPHDQLGRRAFVDWIVQLVLLNAWAPHHFEWNIPSWSISAEVFAYLLFPILVASHVRNRRAAEATLLAALVAFYALIGATTGNLDVVVGLAPLRCLAGFALGMLLYFNRSLVSNTSDRCLTILQIVATFASLMILASYLSDPLVIPAFGLLIFTTWTDRGSVARLLSMRLPRWLGEISYSVYLLHVPLAATTWFIWIRVEKHLGLSPPLTRSIWLVLIFAVVLSMSTLSYKHVELPARRAMLRRWHSKRPPTGDVAVAAP